MKKRNKERTSHGNNQDYYFQNKSIQGHNNLHVWTNSMALLEESSGRTVGKKGDEDKSIEWLLVSVGSVWPGMCSCTQPLAMLVLR